ncbi:AraC-type DNA-binding protein [Paracoccus seriniphilus]|uniref:AraC-type DNA-binding protein n=2 Tax=Paracoccus seriniphilus TaxID=184748 RepID=A0A239PVJ6_9RHOB|nr:helix-turn-helix domain-containing protein [Paracoccus seriniphilus]SNT74053.1 AraC-type DNA-binding protein [Paracoccus seriniphilus]
MKSTIHSTKRIAPEARAAYWDRVIADTYFPLRLTFRDPATFDGRLTRRDIGAISLSRLNTKALLYERLRQHLRTAVEEEYLIAIPRLSPVEFYQVGREVRCDPGGFILERGDEPYRFSYGATNELYVLKLPKRVLSEKLRNPDRFCAQVIDASTGIAHLFSETVRQLQGLPLDAGHAAVVLGRQLVELLALALDQETEQDNQMRSAVQAAHLRRAEKVIRDNLANPALNPEMVAKACGISKRYLHELFNGWNTSVSRFIREERLIAARDMLQASPYLPIADVAYRFGFSDQAQFSRRFRDRFDQTPSAFRAAQR